MQRRTDHESSAVHRRESSAAPAMDPGRNSLTSSVPASGAPVQLASRDDWPQAALVSEPTARAHGLVQFKGGIGEVGDSYEQHADEVADRVVRGESAEGLLDGVAAGAAPSVQMDRNRPLREHTIRFQIRVPSTYERLRDAVVEELSHDLMSRTEVDRPDGTRGPARREETLVDASNLREVFGNLQPGSRIVLTARLIPGQARYESVEFSMPNTDRGTQEEIRVEGRAPQEEQPQQGEQGRQLPEGADVASTRRPEELEALGAEAAQEGALHAAGFVAEVILESVVLGALVEIVGAALTVYTIATEIADLADNSGQTTEAATGFGLAHQSHKIAEYAFTHSLQNAQHARDSYLHYLGGQQREVYGRLRQKILDGMGDLNAQCTRAMRLIDQQRDGGQPQGGQRFATEQELSAHLLATAGGRASARVHARNYDSAYRSNRSYAEGTPALR